MNQKPLENAVDEVVEKVFEKVFDKALAKQKLIQRIKEVIIEALDLELDIKRFDTDAALFGTGLSFDSIDAVEIVVSMEQAFDIKFEGELNIYALRTVGKMAEAIFYKKPTVLNDFVEAVESVNSKAISSKEGDYVT